MNKQPFAEFVADAATIKEAGRWQALNQHVREMAANPGTGNGWYVQIFGQLCFQILSGYNSLSQAYDGQHDDASLLAWRARNLLELSVWATYFAASRDNARRLYEDAGRDAHELFRLFENLGQTEAEGADFDGTAEGKSALETRAIKEGIETLEDHYMSVAKAAETCGLSSHFRRFNKLLSKFAHPTALQILGIPNDVQLTFQRNCFLGLGCLFFAGAFDAMERLTQSRATP